MTTKTSERPTCPNCGERKMVKNGHCTHTGLQEWICRDKKNNTYCYATKYPDRPPHGHNDKPRKASDVKPRKQFKRKIEHRRILFTAAQNATPLHFGFWNALKALAKDIDAEIAVIPLRYKNATSQWSESQQNHEHWLRDLAEHELAEHGINAGNYLAMEGDLFVKFQIIASEGWTAVCDQYVRRYLYEQRKKFNDNIVVVGDVKVQPTMQDPLSGMEGFTRGESGIFGHTKLRMKCISTPQDRHPKILTTTGACTVPNYTDSKAGKKGEFHHVQGAVLLEIETRSKFHIHHINAIDDGSFIYRRKAYLSDGSVSPAGPDQAMIFGDAHYRFADPKVVEATFGPGGLVEQHDPAVLVWHDLLDAYFGNPHHAKAKNPFVKKAKEQAGFHIAADEVFETIAWMSKLGAGRENIVVPSNHDDMLARWIIREDWRDLHGENMEFYLETALMMTRSARMSDTGAKYDDPFIYWIRQKAEGDVVALDPERTFMIGDIALNYHGDDGPGGARGTVKNLSQIGVKLITGHGHAPEILDGHTRVGTMTKLTAEYVTGPNNWLNAHATIDAFGKRHLHICIDGKFYMED